MTLCTSSGHIKTWNIFFYLESVWFFPWLCCWKKNEGTFEGNLCFQGVSIFSFFGNQRVFKFCSWLSILFVRIKSNFICLPHLWSQIYHYENFNKINMIDFTQCWNESWWYHLYEFCMIICAMFFMIK